MKLKLFISLFFIVSLSSCSSEVVKSEKNSENYHIAFGSCLSQKKSQKILNPIIQQKPDLFIFTGDAIYTKGNDVEKYKKQFKKFRKSSKVNKLFEAVPVIGVWDDNDYGLNDGGADHPWKHKASKIFLDAFDVPRNDPRRSRDGLYYSKIYETPKGTIQVILLDTRFFRSTWKPTDSREVGKERYISDDSKEKTVLGEVQWEWLANELRLRADLRVIVTSIQYIADVHGFEKWGLFPREQKKLAKLIKKSKAKRTIIVSGDRHYGSLYKRDLGAGYPLYEITASGLNKTVSKKYRGEEDPYHIGEAYWEKNYGWLDIDFSNSKVSLQLRDIDGQVVREQTVNFSEIE